MNNYNIKSSDPINNQDSSYLGKRLSTAYYFGRCVAVETAKQSMSLVPAAVCRATKLPYVSNAIDVGLGLGSLASGVNKLGRACSFRAKHPVGSRLSDGASAAYQLGISGLILARTLSDDPRIDIAFSVLAIGTGVTKIYSATKAYKLINHAVADQSISSLKEEEKPSKTQGYEHLEKLAQMVVSGCFGGISVYRGSLGLVRSLQSGPLFCSSVQDEDLAGKAITSLQFNPAANVSVASEGKFLWRPAEICPAQTLGFLARDLTQCPFGFSFADEFLHEKIDRGFNVAKYGVRLFSSSIHDEVIDEDLARKVLMSLQLNPAANVSFTSEGMFPWKVGGTCSARTLDFLARHLTECSLDSSFAEQAYCIAGFSRFYESFRRVFPSRQAAFDMIRVNASATGNNLEVMAAKAASLARLHNINLKTSSESLPLSRGMFSKEYNNLLKSELPVIVAQSHGRFLKNNLPRDYAYAKEDVLSKEQAILDAVRKLPYGRYLLRGIDYKDNEKQESQGHSMALIKSANGSFFFNPGEGATAVLRDPSRSSTLNIMAERSWYDRIAFYEASCGEGGCTNISDDVQKIKERWEVA